MSSKRSIEDKIIRLTDKGLLLLVHFDTEATRKIAIATLLIVTGNSLMLIAVVIKMFGG